MSPKLIIFLFISSLLQTLLSGQSETYTVKKTVFSLDNFSEFSPVYYKNGLVYCSNHNISLANYSNSKNEGPVKINYVDTTNDLEGQKTRMFSKDLTTKLNDGPVTFNHTMDTVYFSRNLVVEGKQNELSSTRNKLGIFSAILVDGKWTKIREFRYNNEWYNITTPCLSPDGSRIYFASDKPDGYGGSDLYYCQWKKDYWDNPVNLGPVINTKGNEAYPFVNQAGEIFFSSDGHPGLGGKDIFFSHYADSAWLPPVHLDPSINSPYDDFGITIDSTMNEGYFSSNRDKSIDIYHFKTNFQQIFYSNIQKENQYCFIFSDKGTIVVDTTNLQLKWNFGDGKTATGAAVSHCFLDPGNYNVKLDVVERGSGKLFFTKLEYNLVLTEYEQPYINSNDIAVKGDIIEFDGQKSNFPGYSILNYSWDFADGTRLEGERVNHTFNEKGDYLVNLGVTIKSDSTGTIQKTGVSKKITVLNDQQEKATLLAKKSSVKVILPDIRNYSNAKIKTQYSAETEFQKEAIFTIEIQTSKNKLSLNSPTFRNIPKKYTLKERFEAEDGIYCYTIDQQMSLMATYPAYKELLGLGFKETVIKEIILTDPAEKELYGLIKIYGAFAELYFDESDRLTANAFIMLDQVVKLLNKYPNVKLEVAVHSDNTGPAESSLTLSQRRAQFLINYLVNRGINVKRLIATGFGGSKPIAPNYSERDRKLNRRIDFIITNVN
jgi:outer membrane protein OmpA-like peptidoglycan-associated protein